MKWLRELLFSIRHIINSPHFFKKSITITDTVIHSIPTPHITVWIERTLQTIRDLKSAPFSPLMLRVSMKSVEATHTIPPLLVPVYVRRINNLKKVQRLVDLSSAAEA